MKTEKIENIYFPKQVPNWIEGREQRPHHDQWFEKRAPHDDSFICETAKSGKEDVDAAVAAAKAAQLSWASMPAVKRGELLLQWVLKIKENQEWVSRLVALETGKSLTLASGETAGAVSLGLFYASEGQRLYGRTTTSGIPGRTVMTIRQPIGVAGLIVAANTPLPNIAWKAFPALICGNTAVVKASEDTPLAAWIMGKLAQEAGIPAGVLNFVHGHGAEAGAALVEHPDVNVVSFTGSTETGIKIQDVAGKRLARISLELGGKNPLVICDDADLDNAVKWALLSAFSNSGQRCAAASRIIIFESIYEPFKARFLDKVSTLKMGCGDGDDMGPVINKSQLDRILRLVEKARAEGARILTGGHRLTEPPFAKGLFLAPTVLEGVGVDADISQQELFGPVTVLYKARGFHEALNIANASQYGLTASIHTKSLHRAMVFADQVQAGVASVNGGTHGSEPHLPFGGRKFSGNGTREPGTEALDVYSELKNVYINSDLTLV